MKKLLAFILALACALSLVACGKKNDDNKTDPTPAPDPQPTVTTAEFTHGYVDMKLELPEEELPVYADPDMMQRALHNLLGNAMHHIGKDGIFVLRAFRCTEGVRVEVEDHGPGIAAADLPYIFDRYYRSRSDAGKQGTGLGLSITKAIFQQHSFRFGVQSTVGKGTTFWFVMSDLPYVDDTGGN